MSDLTTLATECEGAEGPSRELDLEIARAVGLCRTPEEGSTQVHFGQWWPHYTASLDAAMTLVPEGCKWQVSTEEPGPWAWVGEPGSDVPAIMCATPALALTAACLRAMAG